MQPDGPSRKPPSRALGIDAIRANSRNPQQPVRSNVIRFRRPGNGEGPDPDDPLGHMAGLSPRVVKLYSRSPQIVKQFVFEKGNYPAIAKREEVGRREVTEVVAKAIEPWLPEILAGKKAA